MNTIKKFIDEHKHFLYLLILVPLLICFSLCQRFLKPQYIMHCGLDDYIPFLKIFILAYIFWFIYMAIGFVYFGLKSRSDFLNLVKFIFLGMGISYVIYFILPSGQNLRPVLKQNDILTQMVGAIYYIDPPTNVCPSIHVINSIGVNAVVINSSLFKNNKKIKVLSTIAMILICLSTMFIKQHSLLDVIAGIGLSTIIYVFIYTIPRIRKEREVVAKTKEV
ncbi:phosphatase PAP2 family protein [Clostridium ganghwense]|uniref:Phosphatase PAP2 family protein n=1 Tax=Clostridium ganghwense TaxID=312089 RepID=A0ABT4CMS2_9CLOT|nr:phosphatase PAP2 family protein [Clostridium ganghwense]MCY6369733.1 phosphatase PAP2 family protein [Clostridium ganghwense]